MPLTEYKDLTEEQKQLISKMYARLDNVAGYQYNFDDKGYHGRERIQLVKVKQQKEPEPKLVSKKKKPDTKPKRTRETQK